MSGRRQARELEPLLDHAVAYAAERGVEIRSVLKIAHRVSQGILSTAREEQCNFLLIGRPVTRSLLERLVASIVERVLNDAPSQVGIVYGDVSPQRVRGVVVPIASGASSQLAAELAPAFAAALVATARAVTVIPNRLPSHEAAALERDARETLKSAGVSTGLQVLRRDEVGTGLLASIEPGDMVLIGAPTTDPVAALIAETLPHTLARDGRAPMIVVRDIEAHRTGRFERFFERGR